MENISIQQASVIDAKEILALQRLAYQSEALLCNDNAIPPLTQTLAEIKAEFTDHVFLKAMLETRIIGSVRAKLLGITCFVGRLIVHPNHQGHGIGSALMKEIEKHYATAKRLELFTGHESEHNISLYQRLGYSMFRTERVNDKLSFIFMEKINV
jgi:ribosomal protein S18 acetylase RimI-like enzyme